MPPTRSDATIEFSAAGHNHRFVQCLNAMSSRTKFAQVIRLAALGSAVARRLVGDDRGVELFGRLGENPRGHLGSRAPRSPVLGASRSFGRGNKVDDRRTPHKAVDIVGDLSPAALDHAAGPP